MKSRCVRDLRSYPWILRYVLYHVAKGKVMTVRMSALAITIFMDAGAYSPAKASSDVLQLSDNSLMISTTHSKRWGLLALVGEAIRGPIADEVMSTAARETLSRGYRYFSITQANSSTVNTMNVIIAMSNQKSSCDAKKSSTKTQKMF